MFVLLTDFSYGESYSETSKFLSSTTPLKERFFRPSSEPLST